MTVAEAGLVVSMRFFIPPRSFLFWPFFLTLVICFCSGCGGIGKRQIDYSQIRRPADVGYKAAARAEALIGTPYKYGGRNPQQGFDCSGLTYYVYGRYGHRLPRRAQDQLKAGRWVSKKKLRRGDLVFFKTSLIGGYHVGIYAGNGRFIHAPRKGKRVELKRMDKGYYKRKYYTARRIVS